MSALATAAPERSRLTLSETLADSRVMAGRQLRKVLRRPVYVVSVFVQPVILILMFRYVFGGAIDTGAVSYVDFLLPGIIVQTAVFGALLTGMGLTEDIKAGVIDRLRSLPIAQSAVLIGRTASDLVVNSLTLVVMVLVGVAVGFRPDQPVYDLVLAYGLVLAFSFAFSWVSAWVGLLVRDPETVQSAGFLWVFPLAFVSSAFVPTDSMPGAIQAFADVNPMTFVVDAARALTIGHGDALGPALGALAWIAGLLLVFIPLTVRAFRRRRARRASRGGRRRWPGWRRTVPGPRRPRRSAGRPGPDQGRRARARAAGSRPARRPPPPGRWSRR
jgi:ABC transporter DrrB family efflux protein